MLTKIHEFVDSAQTGTNERVICRLPSGWLVMGEQQVVPGYCLLLPDPVVPHLNAMDIHTRIQFLKDMTLAGDAILQSTDAVRINYEMLGNAEPALHAHLFPRYDSEEESLRTRPIWFYEWESSPMFDLERDSSFIGAMRLRLQGSCAVG